MRLFTVKMVAVFVCVFLAVYAANVVAFQKLDGSFIALEAKQIAGETYVSAASLLDSLGGTGAFDSTTQTFVYSPAVAYAADLAEKTAPSVVAIIGKPDTSGNKPVDRFSLAHGTGVVLTADGWIVTNAHVVEKMKEIVVLTSNEKQFKVEKVVKDTESDLAIVKIAASGLRPAPFADSDKVRAGEAVMAIGTPVSFSLRNSVTMGVVSGVNRSVNGSYRLIQTDAAINPGNSGGPLVNMNGEIIGINSLKFVDATVDNMGFSIPANTVSYIVDQLKKHGKVKRVHLGLELEESWEAVVGLSTQKPMTVTWVSPGSSADKAGIRKGDQIYALDKENIVTLVDLSEKLKTYEPGDSVVVTLLAAGDIVQKTVVLTEKK